MNDLKFKCALVSVSDKTGLVEFLRPLVGQGLKVVSTGGTAEHLKKNGISVQEVSESTGFPEVMDGRVKTLHPRVHMRLLARSYVAEDFSLLREQGLEPFDLVLVNLYPFEEKLSLGLSESEQIEFIDIGGPSLLRAAAKSFERLAVICDPCDYAVAAEKGLGDLAWRKHLAAKVFAHVSSYDGMIARHLGAEISAPEYSWPGCLQQALRYGENPQQRAVWVRERGAEHGLHEAQILQGKELSYNNLLDLDAAVQAVQDHGGPAAVAVKHTNPCGVGRHRETFEALNLALKADPVSVFGGIVALNRPIDEREAEALSGIFLECVISPQVTLAARRILSKKANLRVLEWPGLATPIASDRVRTILGGALVQQADQVESWQAQWKILGEAPSSKVKADLEMAWKVVARLKSNAIALVSNGQTVGLGMGQVNRVDAVIQAIRRWHEFHADKKDVVLASDAFFPFPDSIDEIARAGIQWVIQPGGSMRDAEVFARAKESGLNMVITGQRHFLH